MLVSRAVCHREEDMSEQILRSTRLLLLFVPILMTVACASKSDVSQAQASANNALSTAQQALQTAQKAETDAQAANQKADQMYQRNLRK
jgi:hypothetical protein